MSGAETWHRILNAIERLQAKAPAGGLAADPIAVGYIHRAAREARPSRLAHQCRLPPFSPPSRPSATAAGFFPSCSFVSRRASPVAISTISSASWLA
jgi:hypothetical protein